MKQKENIDGNPDDIGREDVEKGFQVVERSCEEGAVKMDPNGDSIPMHDLNLKNTEAIISTPNDVNEI